MYENGLPELLSQSGTNYFRAQCAGNFGFNVENCVQTARVRKRAPQRSQARKLATAHSHNRTPTTAPQTMASANSSVTTAKSDFLQLFAPMTVGSWQSLPQRSTTPQFPVFLLFCVPATHVCTSSMRAVEMRARSFSFSLEGQGEHLGCL